MEDTEFCALSMDLFILTPERFPTFSVLSFQNGDMYRQINIHYDIAIRRRCISSLTYPLPHSNRCDRRHCRLSKLSQDS